MPFNSSPTRKTFLLVAAVAGASSACVPETPTKPDITSPTFVGSDQCESCHQSEFAEWRGSHHQLAMQAANSETVIGDFSDVTVPYFDTHATFSRHDEKFVVTIENASGEPQEFNITHTFGVMPLQQYLVDAPGGRKQALQFTWDSRRRDDGGQRWYHLYADEYIGPDDPLHWTGPFFNWNYMCAECHSTNVDLGYDIESNSFNTTYSEVSVGCEACHGPASNHVRQANSGSFDEFRGLLVDLDDRASTMWIMNVDTGISEPSSVGVPRLQPEACGRCHSRRSPVSATYEYGKPLADTHMPSLLEENLYYADGRIQDEVYVYGSFLQSRMYAAGVTCTDCHDPHSGRLHAGPQPNDTCSTCHLRSTFATADHADELVGDCVACHMPATTYMGVDDRRDHSFRLPGTSDDPDHYGTIIAAGRAENANDELLEGIANDAFPPIARATMLTLLETIDTDESQAAVLRNLDDPDPLVRIGALRALRVQPPHVRMRRGSHLLRDPIRSVRVEAALTYVDFHDLLPIEESRVFADVADDYRQSMATRAALPDVALSLAAFETRMGDMGEATRLYKHAMRIGDNLAAVHHAYGLYLVRSGKPTEALEHLQTARQLEPGVARFTYVYGVALSSMGKSDEAVGVLADARKRFPGDFDIGWALATIYRDIGNPENARQVAEQLNEEFPENLRVEKLLLSLGT